jgi:hypothetical protein
MIVRLTDGQEDYAQLEVKDVDALDELNRTAFQCTDGNLYWYSINGLPRVPAVTSSTS